MTMLVDEVTDMNDYGHFVDIDLCLNNRLNTQTSKVNVVNLKKDTCICAGIEKRERYDRPFFTSINVFGFITVSILFFKIWILSPRT